MGLPGTATPPYHSKTSFLVVAVLFKCSCKTNEESREIQTETLTIKATPLPSGVVKAKTGNETDSTVYADWYKAVYMPTVTGVNTGEE